MPTTSRQTLILTVPDNWSQQDKEDALSAFDAAIDEAVMSLENQAPGASVTVTPASL